MKTPFTQRIPLYSPRSWMPRRSRVLTLKTCKTCHRVSTTHVALRHLKLAGLAAVERLWQRPLPARPGPSGRLAFCGGFADFATTPIITIIIATLKIVSTLPCNCYTAKSARAGIIHMGHHTSVARMAVKHFFCITFTNNPKTSKT